MYRSARAGDAPAANADATPATSEADPRDRPSAGIAFQWLLLSACGSGLLLATTNQMSLDIAVVPFLWILPLSVYLLTFILSFDHQRWYVRPLFIALLPLALINAVRLLYGGVDLGIVDQVVSYSLTLFVCCMCCHGELSRARPAARHLTFFFLIVSIGGAVGGLFVAIAAPALFPSFYEYHLLLVACYMLMAFVLAYLLIAGGLAPASGRVTRALVALCWIVGVASIALGSVVLLRPETWLEDASSNARATFAAWQVYMAWYGTVTAVFVLLALEMWRRMEGVALRGWWTSRKGVACVGLTSIAALGLVSLTGGLVWQIANDERRVVEQGRNFYGALAIKERDIGDRGHRLSLTHGRISHGSQLQLFPSWPTTYFGPETGIGLAITHHPKRSDETAQFRIGVVGLGVGTIAAFANARVDPKEKEDAYVTVRNTGEADYLRFYQLNPLVTRWANEKFTFLEDATARGADVAVFEGDARIVLERQLEQGNAQRFDVLAIDAFSSDAIPIHLLTLESVQIYLAHLQEDGILAFHVTNRFVDLLPIVRRLADVTGLSAIYVENYSSSSRGVSSSDWVLLTKNQAFLDLEIVREDEEEMPAPGPLWTDDFSSLLGIVEIND